MKKKNKKKSAKITTAEMLADRLEAANRESVFLEEGQFEMLEQSKSLKEYLKGMTLNEKRNPHFGPYNHMIKWLIVSIDVFEEFINRTTKESLEDIANEKKKIAEETLNLTKNGVQDI